MTDRKQGFASEADVKEFTNLPKTTRFRLIHSGQFPKPKRISDRRVGTLWDDLYRWAESRPVSDIPSPNPDAGKAA